MNRNGREKSQPCIGNRKLKCEKIVASGDQNTEPGLQKIKAGTQHL